MANMGDRIVIKFLRGYSADWARTNPTLELGEPGYERDTGKLKIGDGSSPWNALGYFAGSVSDNGEVSSSELNAHINSLTPHPAYDDGPSFLLLYENAKV